MQGKTCGHRRGGLNAGRWLKRGQVWECWGRYSKVAGCQRQMVGPHTGGSTALWKLALDFYDTILWRRRWYRAGARSDEEYWMTSHCGHPLMDDAASPSLPPSTSGSQYHLTHTPQSPPLAPSTNQWWTTPLPPRTASSLTTIITISLHPGPLHHLLSWALLCGPGMALPLPGEGGPRVALPLPGDGGPLGLATMPELMDDLFIGYI